MDTGAELFSRRWDLGPLVDSTFPLAPGSRDPFCDFLPGFLALVGLFFFGIDIGSWTEEHQALIWVLYGLKERKVEHGKVGGGLGCLMPLECRFGGLKTAIELRRFGRQWHRLGGPDIA